MGCRVIDLVGSRYGRLVATGLVGKTRWGNMLYSCLCDCGTVVVVASGDLRTGHTQSCGCLQRERTSAAALTHGEAKKGQRTSEYQSWADMIKRCEDQTFITFKNYGGRGIKVCKRWRTSYEHFLTDMGRKPTPKHTLDRINNDGDYKPSNCRWATRKEQNGNKRPRSRIR